MDQPGIMGPASFPIRDPKRSPQVVGRSVNPPGWMDLGGLTGPSKWGPATMFRIEKPTGVRGAKDTAEKTIGS